MYMCVMCRSIFIFIFIFIIFLTMCNLLLYIWINWVIDWTMTLSCFNLFIIPVFSIQILEPVPDEGPVPSWCLLSGGFSIGMRASLHPGWSFGLFDPPSTQQCYMYVFVILFHLHFSPTELEILTWCSLLVYINMYYCIYFQSRAGLCVHLFAFVQIEDLCICM